MRILLLIIVLLPMFSAYGGKAECQGFLDKLRNIQSKQKLAHSGIASNRLKVREDKARTKWWQCQQGKVAAKKTYTKKKRSEISAKDRVVNRPIFSDTKETVPFSTKRGIVIKGDFSGEKQAAWQDFYKMPVGCKRPESTQAFASCMEQRREQKDIFLKNYLRKNTH